jgi:DNA-directed RNA polymerase delta subunit
MGVKEKDKSLLEIAVELLSTKHKPQPIMQIAKEAMEIKGLKTAQAKELLPQFLLDFQASGYFVYCGDGCWDLKDHQPTSVLDKDGTDFDIYSEDDEEVKKNELKDDSYEVEARANSNHEDDEEETEEDDDISSLLKETNSDELDIEENVITGFEEFEGDEDEE